SLTPSSIVLADSLPDCIPTGRHFGSDLRGWLWLAHQPCLVHGFKIQHASRVPVTGSPTETPAPAANVENAAPAEAPAESARDLTDPPPTSQESSAAATNRASQPTTRGRTMLYAVDGVALATLGGWLIVLFRRRRRLR